MRCSRVRRLVTAEGATPLSPDAREHLRGCAECRAFAERWADVANVLESPLCEAQPDAGFAARVAARLLERGEPLAWAARRLLPAAAALALVLLGWCFLATPGPTSLTEAAASSDPLVWVAESGEEGGG